MQEYDATLKLLLRRSAKVLMHELTGTSIRTWLDIQLPEVRNPQLDLLGETADGDLIHLELQSRNDPAMPLRMLEYCVGIRRLCGRFPQQLCLYVGTAPLRMPTRLCSSQLSFLYSAIDIRSLDGERLLGSSDIGDNVIAILARLRDQRNAVRRIVNRITGLPESQREAAFRQLLTLSGLRRLEELVEQEARKMPIIIDIRKNKVLGREYKRGELAVLRRQIETRFGPLPGWAEESLNAMSPAALERLSPRVLTARSLRTLLKPAIRKPA